MDGRSLLQLVVHHSITDFWSLSIFWNEFWKLVDKENDHLQQPNGSYIDYSNWQRKSLTKESDKYKNYWHSLLEMNLD